jgi:hypothetical protein
MSTSPSPPKIRAQAKPPVFASNVYWLGIAFAVVCLSVNLAISALRGADAQTAGIAILLLGIGITTLCVILWIGHVTGIRPIQGKIALAIWTILIASVLGTSAAAYKTALIQQHVTIERLILLDESEVFTDAQNHLRLKTLMPRQNYDYTATTNGKGVRDITIAFGIVVSGFQRDLSGNFDIDGKISFSSEGAELLDSGDLLPTTDDGYMKERPILKNLNMENVEQVFGPIKGKVLYIQVLREFQQPVLDKASKELRITIRDKHNSTYSDISQRVALR